MRFAIPLSSNAHQIGCLHLLPSMTRSVVVPPSVPVEIENGRLQGVDLPEIEKLHWVQVMNPTKPHRFLDAVKLGRGERDVLKLASESPGTVAFLDDRTARRIANELSIPAIGTLGLLVEAKQLGLIDAVEPYLSDLQRLGFRCSGQTRAMVLRAAGEAALDSNTL